MRRIILATAATLAILAARLTCLKSRRSHDGHGAERSEGRRRGHQSASGRSGCLPPRLALRAVWLWLAAAYAGGLRPITAATDITADGCHITAATVGPTGATGGKLGDARQSAVERSNEVRALVAEREAARLQHVACQKITCERKPIGQYRCRRVLHRVRAGMPEAAASCRPMARRHCAKPRGRISARRKRDRRNCLSPRSDARSRPKPSSDRICNSKRTTSGALSLASSSWSRIASRLRKERHADRARAAAASARRDA